MKAFLFVLGFLCVPAHAADSPDIPKSEHAVFGKQLLEIDPPVATEAATISPDGTRILSLHPSKRIRILWDAHTGEIVKKDQDSMETSGASPAPVFSHDSGFAIVSLEIPQVSLDESEVGILDAATGNFLQKITGIDTAVAAAASVQSCIVSHLALSGDAQTLAASSACQGVWIFQQPDWHLVYKEYGRQDSSLRALALNQNGSLLAVGGLQGELDIRDALTNETKLKLEGHMGPISKLIFDNRGHLFSAARATFLTNMQHMQQYLAGTDETNKADEENIKEWDLATGRLVRSFVYKGPLHTGTEDIALSPDGKTLVAAKTYRTDTRLVAYDVDTGKIIDEVNTSPAPLKNLSFTADGKTLCVAAANIINLFHVNNAGAAR